MTTFSLASLKAPALLAAAVLAIGAGMTAGTTTADAKPFKHKKFGIVINIGGGYHGYAHGYRGYGSCRWLKRKALVTGSRYWWRRYEDCRYGY